MVKFKNEIEKENLIIYLKNLKRKQKIYSNTDQVCFLSVSLYLLFKNKLFFENFLTHPVILLVKPFYEEKFMATNSIELEEILVNVLEYELNSDNEEHLTQKELETVIKIHAKIKEKNLKKASKKV